MFCMDFKVIERRCVYCGKLQDVATFPNHNFDQCQQCFDDKRASWQKEPKKDYFWLWCVLFTIAFIALSVFIIKANALG